VQQAVDAAQVHERTVVGDVLDHALDHSTFVQGFEQLLAFFAHAGLKHCAARQNDVVALAVELDDLEFECLAFVRRGVLDRTQVDQRAGQEGADAIGHDGKTALDLAGDGAVDHFAGFQGLLELQPGRQALGAVTRQDGVAVAVFERIDGNRDKITGFDFELALVVQEFFERDQGLGLEAGVDHDEIVIDADDFSGNHLTGLHVLVLDAFREKVGETFAAGGDRGCNGGHSCIHLAEMAVKKNTPGRNASPVE
jgi:hypothetical protein